MEDKISIGWKSKSRFQKKKRGKIVLYQLAFYLFLLVVGYVYFGNKQQYDQDHRRLYPFGPSCDDIDYEAEYEACAVDYDDSTDCSQATKFYKCIQNTAFACYENYVDTCLEELEDVCGSVPDCTCQTPQLYFADSFFDQPYCKNKGAPNSGAIILHIIGILYMFLGLSVVCDEYFCGALDVMVEHYKVKPDVAGATFMAAGGSAPELFTSLMGVFFSESDVGFGTIVGSAVFNVLFVIGLCAAFAKSTLQLTWWPLFRDCSYYLISLSVLTAFAADGIIKFYEALILFFLYCLYVTLMRWNSDLEKFFEGLLFQGKKKQVSPVLQPDAGDENGSKCSHAQELGDSVPPLPVPQLQSPAAKHMHQVVKRDVTRGLRRGSLSLDSARDVVEKRRAIREGIGMIKATAQIFRLHRRVQRKLALEQQRQQNACSFNGIESKPWCPPPIREEQPPPSPSNEPYPNSDDPASSHSQPLADMKTTPPPWQPLGSKPEYGDGDEGAGSRKTSVEAKKESTKGNGSVVPLEQEKPKAKTFTPTGADEAAGGMATADLEKGEKSRHEDGISELVSFDEGSGSPREEEGQESSRGDNQKQALLQNQDGENAKPPQSSREEEKEGNDAGEDGDEHNPLQWPDTPREQIVFIFTLPVVALLHFAIPNCSNPKYRDYFLVTFSVSLVWIAIFSFLLVWWATIFGAVIGIDDIIMGLTFLAMGTSIPDAVSSVVMARIGEGDMAVSSSIGSNIFDILFGLPVPWFISTAIVVPIETGALGTISVESKYIVVYVLLLMIMVFLVIGSIMYRKWKLDKPLGAIMAGLYGVFLTIAITIEQTEPESLAW